MIRQDRMQRFAEFVVADHFESTVDLYWDTTRRGYATARRLHRRAQRADSSGFISVLVRKTEQLNRIYETYLLRESARIERLGYILDESVRVEPYD
jgi:hypothetical protein